jgi:4-hydroxy-tetrahydrodipicolinate reductase
MHQGGTRVLVLGRGKTGSLIAQIASERGHAVQVLGAAENPEGRALTQELLAEIDVVIDFTTPEAVTANLRALLSQGARVVVGTTGWYGSLPEMERIALANGGTLLHGTNFSLGVQAFFRAARELVRGLNEATLAIHETHHVTKKDAPSGTALTLQRVVERAGGLSAPITSHREGDAAGLHTLTVRLPHETVVLTHEAGSRQSFAIGAVRAAEWLVGQPAGVWDFAEVATRLG